MTLALGAARFPNMANIDDSCVGDVPGHTRATDVSSHRDHGHGSGDVPSSPARCDASTRWLKALKEVANKLDKSLKLAADDDPCCDEMDRLPEEGWKRIRLADDPITHTIDETATSDGLRDKRF